MSDYKELLPYKYEVWRLKEVGTEEEDESDEEWTKNDMSNE